MHSTIQHPPASTVETRINARLDAHATAQLQYLTATTGLGVSEVVRVSLAHYYRAQRAQQVPALQHLLPLIGRFQSGRADISENVKQVIAQHLSGKHASTPARAAPAPKRAVR